ncbi:lysoplasmalogenase [Primorskyibacter sp. 2E233]|uniref:lysoplasmalogenase n=1 Tax=Primorskyibacter sp. 2E233 TaxID=3413431 RepID=UPI003BF185BB
MIDWGLSFAAAAALIYLIRFAGKFPSLAKSVIKSLSVGVLAMVAVLAGLPMLLSLALALGALGDACLSRDGDKAFLAGLGSFALSHLAYAALFLRHPASDLSALLSLGALPATAGVLGLAFWMGWRLWPVTGDLRGPVMGYVAVIAGMGLAAVSVGPPVLWAALLFMISDTVLAAELFLLGPDSRWRKFAPYVVWSTYWLAQALFLLSFLALAALGTTA